MSLTFLFLAACLGFGGAAAVSARGPMKTPDLPAPFRENDLRRFTPRNTLFIVGPDANHPACKLQRRLLKPAIATLIREDVSVIELYGDSPARRNGDVIDWLDPALLRHAMDAESGFAVIYLDEAGRQLFRSEGPIVAPDLFARIGVEIDAATPKPSRASLVLSKLKAA
ncbi:MAG: hypothetical protein ACFB00_01960 [Parvularculaceae bacterium]